MSEETGSEFPLNKPEVLFDKGDVAIILDGGITINLTGIADAQLPKIQAAMADPKNVAGLQTTLRKHLGMPLRGDIIPAGAVETISSELETPQWAFIGLSQLQHEVQGLYDFLQLSDDERTLLQMMGGVQTLSAIYTNQPVGGQFRKVLVGYALKQVVPDIYQAIDHFAPRLNSQLMTKFSRMLAQYQQDIESENNIHRMGNPFDKLLSETPSGTADGVIVQLAEQVIMTPQRRQLLSDANKVLNYNSNENNKQPNWKEADTQAKTAGAEQFLKRIWQGTHVGALDIEGTGNLRESQGSLHFFYAILRANLSSHAVLPEFISNPDQPNRLTSGFPFGSK